jgi:hypothetical protein
LEQFQCSWFWQLQNDYHLVIAKTIHWKAYRDATITFTIDMMGGIVLMFQEKLQIFVG